MEQLQAFSVRGNWRTRIRINPQWHVATFRSSIASIAGLQPLTPWAAAPAQQRRREERHERQHDAAARAAACERVDRSFAIHRRSGVQARVGTAISARVFACIRSGIRPRGRSRIHHSASVAQLADSGVTDSRAASTERPGQRWRVRARSRAAGCRRSVAHVGARAIHAAAAAGASAVAGCSGEAGVAAVTCLADRDRARAAGVVRHALAGRRAATLPKDPLGATRRSARTSSAVTGARRTED